MSWSWWSPHHVFDAQVLVCALGFRIERVVPVDENTAAFGVDPTWSHVITDVLRSAACCRRWGPTEQSAIGLGSGLNFRDEYYGLIPAVSDVGRRPAVGDERGRRLPGTVPLGPAPGGLRQTAVLRLPVPTSDGSTPADARLGTAQAPKVLVANQTRIVEAVADPCGAWLPGVPVTSVVPTADTSGVGAGGPWC